MPALLVVCADGGANRLNDLALTEREEQEFVRGFEDLIIVSGCSQSTGTQHDLWRHGLRTA